LATLPIFYDDVWSSLKAAMVFPHDQEKAKAFVGWHQARGCVKLGASDPAWETLENVPAYLIEVAGDTAAFTRFNQEAHKNYRSGYKAGYVVAALWGLICSDRKTASWEGAIQFVEKFTAGAKPLGNRTTFRDSLTRFQPALHFWGARRLRFDRFSDLEADIFGLLADDTVGYSAEIDLPFFIKEAATLQQQLRLWDRERSARSELLGDGMFECDFGWDAAPRQPGWPDTGKILIRRLNPEFMPVRRPRGRPKKTLSI
jgi:hypothetical protein